MTGDKKSLYPIYIYKNGCREKRSRYIIGELSDLDEPMNSISLSLSLSRDDPLFNSFVRI